jgi:hypothetical protein
MAKWSEITATDKYKNLSVEDKILLKRNFALKHIIPSPKFQSLEEDDQVKFLEKFGTITKEDHIPKRHIYNTMIKVDRAVSSLPAGSEAELGIAMLQAFGATLGLLDRPVEWTAKKVETLGGILPEGTHPKRTAVGLVTKDFPRFFAAELIRFYKPTRIATAAALGPILGAVAGKAGQAVASHPRLALGAAGLVGGAGAGAALDEENRLRGAAIGGTAGLATGVTVGHFGSIHREALKHFFFVERGNPFNFVRAKRVAELEKAAGAREAQEIGDKLFVAQENIPIKLNPLGVAQKNTRVTLASGKKAIIRKGQHFPEGSSRIIKKGQILPREHQRALGKAFRREFELGGKRPEFPSVRPRTPLQEQIEKTVGVKDYTNFDRIYKSIEVHVAFNEKLAAANAMLGEVKRILNTRGSRAQAKVGQVHVTPQGVVEKVTGVQNLTKYGKNRLITEPVAPTPRGQVTAPGSPKIPSEFLAKQDEKVLRLMQRMKGFKILKKGEGASRKQLLALKKRLEEEINKEIMHIETMTRAHYSIFDRKFAEQIRGNPRYQQVYKATVEARDIMDSWSKALAKSGIPSKKSQKIIEDNIGEYMARMYEKKLIKDPLFFGNYKTLRLRLNGLRKRKDLSEEALRSMGIIREPALGTATRVKEISETLANNKLFKIVANNPEWTASSNLTGKMVKMADTKALGPLRGKWVVKGIADEVNAIIGPARNMGLEMYARGMAAFKFGKVILNPATHMRNMITNTMLLDMSGVSHLQQTILFPRMMKDYIQKGPIYQRALRSGAIGGEFYGGDIKIIQDFYTKGSGSNLSRWLNTLKAPFRQAGKIYQAEEQLAKMVKFQHMIQNGADDFTAAEEAQKWLFNYTKIPDAIKVAKQIAPFITFTYKALPRVGETAVKNPLLLYKYYAMFSAVNSASRKTLGMTPVEYAKELDSLPPWMMRSIGGFPSVLFLPYKDKSGRTKFLNLEYILPLGMAPEIIERGIGKGGLAEAIGAFVGNPYFTTLSDIISNKDFRGQDIVPVGATPGEAAVATANHLYRQLAPSLAPGLPGMKGGYSWEKLMDAVNKKKVRFEPNKLKRELTPTILDILMGLKITSVDVQRSTMFKMQEKERTVRKLEMQLFSAMGDPDLTDEERNQIINKFYKKIQKTIRE